MHRRYRFCLKCLKEKCKGVSSTTPLVKEVNEIKRKLHEQEPRFFKNPYRFLEATAHIERLDVKKNECCMICDYEFEHIVLTEKKW